MQSHDIISSSRWYQIIPIDWLVFYHHYHLLHVLQAPLRLLAGEKSLELRIFADATFLEVPRPKAWSTTERNGAVLDMGLGQLEFQDPKMEVLYHIRPYFVGIFPYIGLPQALYMVGTSNLGSWNGHWLDGFKGIWYDGAEEPWDGPDGCLMIFFSVFLVIFMGFTKEWRYSWELHSGVTEDGNWTCSI